MVICLERGADLHMAQLMPLPLTVSCFSKIQIGFTFLVPAHLGSPGKRAVKRLMKWADLYPDSFLTQQYMQQGADLHMAQLMPLPLTVSRFSKIQIGFTFLVPAYPGSHGKTAIKQVRVRVQYINSLLTLLQCFDAVGWAAGRASGL